MEILTRFSPVLIIIAYMLGGLIAYKILTKISTKISSRYQTTSLYWIVIKHILKIGIIIIVIYASLSLIPQLQSVSTIILTSSTIFVAAVGLASQGAIGNAINSMLISFSKPFAVGDRIRLIRNGVTGMVENVTLRHTIIRTFENNRLLIPNSIILDDIIENSNHIDERVCNFLDVRITYESSIAAARDILIKTITNHPLWADTRTDEEMAENVPPLRVMVRDISNFCIEMRVGIWAATIADNFTLCSNVRESLIDEFSAAGIKLFQQTIITRN